MAQLQLGFLPAVGPQSCYVVGASLREVKERITNMETLVGWMRFKDRTQCPIGALACYMVYLVDMQGVPILKQMLLVSTCSVRKKIEFETKTWCVCDALYNGQFSSKYERIASVI